MGSGVVPCPWSDGPPPGKPETDDGEKENDCGGVGVGLAAWAPPVTAFWINGEAGRIDGEVGWVKSGTGAGLASGD